MRPPSVSPRTSWPLLSGGLPLAIALASRLAACELTNGNSVVLINSTSSAGMYEWTVDGVSELYQQSFWFRVGNTGPQTPVYSLNNLTNIQTTSTAATTENANRQLDFSILYTLTGGATNSGSSRLTETVTIRNLTAASLSLHFFQYADFDLAASDAGDTLQLSKTSAVFTSAQQTKTDAVATETLDTPANHGEAGLNNLVYSQLASGRAITLTDVASPVGPGDAAFGFEWDTDLAAHSSFTVILSKGVRDLQAVPEASSGALFCLGLAAGALKRKSRTCAG